MRALGLALVSSIAASVVHAQTAPAPEPQGPSAAAPASSAPAAQGDAQIAALVASQRDALGRECELKDVLAAGSLRYLACGAAGVWGVRVQAGMGEATLDRREVEGEAVGFFVQEGYLWTRISTVHARRCVRVDGAPSALPGPPVTTVVPTPAAPLAPPPVAAPG